jgi:ATP-dependent exoDNAse (exonuclease V) beta subunit
MKPRLIRASAGTGKTFRLSLEYIGLLIKYREELNFEEIVVITFTRKATYEIRERIITFLSRIVNQSDDHLMLSAKLHEYYEDIVVDDEVRTYLQQVYQQIITNKSRLNISTLDSFINQVFKSLIAPYYNIAEYDIDPQCNDKILPKLYDVILQDDNYKLLNSIFQTTHSRQISNYDKFIKKILDDRWLFEFYWRAEIPEIQSINAGEKVLASIKDHAAEL